LRCGGMGGGTGEGDRVLRSALPVHGAADGAAALGVAAAAVERGVAGADGELALRVLAGPGAAVAADGAAGAAPPRDLGEVVLLADGERGVGAAAAVVVGGDPGALRVHGADDVVGAGLVLVRRAGGRVGRR